MPPRIWKSLFHIFSIKIPDKGPTNALTSFPCFSYVFPQIAFSFAQISHCHTSCCHMCKCIPKQSLRSLVLYGTIQPIQCMHQTMRTIQHEHVHFMENHGKIIRKILRHLLRVLAIFMDICGKDIFKLEVALLRFLGHLSNPSLMDWSPENIDVHDFLIFGALRDPYLSIWIYQNYSDQPMKNQWNAFETYFWKIGIQEFEILKFEVLKSWKPHSHTTAWPYSHIAV